MRHLSPSTSLRVMRRLEQAILTGRVKPGTRLPEVRLARELDGSRPSVREVPRRLIDNLSSTARHRRTGR